MIIKILCYFFRSIAWRLVNTLHIFVPRDPQMIAFGSWNGTRYAGNTKALFEYISKQDTHLRAIWITNDENVLNKIRRMGYPAFKKTTPKGIYYCLKAGIYVYDCKTSDINEFLSSGAIRYNLWHGIPLKKIELDISNERHLVKMACSNSTKGALLRFLRPELCETHHYLLSTGPEATARFSSAFNMNENKIKEFGYPIYDNRNQKKPPKEFSGFDYIILYAPTFRDRKEEDPAIDWASLNRLMKKHNALFACKFHPVSKIGDQIPSGLDFIRVLDKQKDIYDFLWISDILVTDYSSVFYDYLLTDNPIVFYAYDLHQYLQECREMYAEYEKEIPEKPVRNFKELLTEIDRLLCNIDNWKPSQRMKELKQRFHAYQDTLASQRIFLHLSQLSTMNGE